MNGTTPYDLANEFARPEMAELLMSYAEMFDSHVTKETRRTTTEHTTSSADPPTGDNGNILTNFYSKYNQEFVNLDLVVEVIDFVDNCSTPGAFFPSHFDSFSVDVMLWVRWIVAVPSGVQRSDRNARQDLSLDLPPLQIPSPLTARSHPPQVRPRILQISPPFMIFSNRFFLFFWIELSLSDYKKMFSVAAVGKRKVILATGLAESSVSFDDVICVIDCGLVRPTENDIVITPNRETRWISKVLRNRCLSSARNR